MAYLISPWAYGIYIGIMAAVFFVFSNRIYFARYKDAKTSTALLKQELDRAAKIESVNERFQMINNWIQANGNHPYIKECVEPSWSVMYGQFEVSLRQGTEITPDVFDYFHEDVFVHHYGKRKLAELVPSVMLSMGIIGTFFGIAIGVSSLHTNGGASQMESGISTLLGGMRVKFYSSIAGILLSIIWQIFDKGKYINQLTTSFREIRNMFDEAFPIQSDSTLMSKMLDNQEKHMQDFQIFMSEQLIPKMMTGFSEALNQTLVPHLEQSKEIMSEMVSSANAGQMEGVKLIASEFLHSLNQITGDHMKDLGDALKTTVEWQERVQQEMSALVQSMQDSASEQSRMVEKTTHLTEEIHRYTENVTEYQTVLERTVAKLNDTTEKHAQLHEATADLLGKMTEERAQFQDNVVTMVQQTELQAAIQLQLGSNLKQIAATAESNESLAQTLGAYAEASTQSGKQLEAMLNSFEQVTTTLVELTDGAGRLLDETSDERKRMDQLTVTIQQTLAEQLNQMDERSAALTGYWDSTNDVMGKSSKQLSVSINEFSQNMHRGIKHTFEQFDQELTKSVSLLTKGVDSMRDGLVEMPDVIQELKQSVAEINKQMKLSIRPQ